MQLDTLVIAERVRIEESFRALERREDGALVAFVEELTGYLASRQRILAPAARAVECSASNDMEQARTRMRVLLLRMGATYRLGAERFDTTLDQLRPIVAEHLAYEEECVAPALTRMLSAEELAALADAMRAEHDAITASFREMVAKKSAVTVESSAA